MCFRSQSLSPEAPSCLVWKLFVLSITIKCYIQTYSMSAKYVILTSLERDSKRLLLQDR